MTYTEWLKTGEYLPEPMRDFHDGKDLFKAIYDTIDVEQHDLDIDFRRGMCYVIDIFLWFMAKHGYTLQKTRKQGVEFKDINETVSKCREERNKAFAEMWKNRNKEQNATS